MTAPWKRYDTPARVDGMTEGASGDWVKHDDALAKLLSLAGEFRACSAGYQGGGRLPEVFADGYTAGKDLFGKDLLG